MKITFEVPDNTVALVLTGLYDEKERIAMATRTVETRECKDGAVIVPQWKGGESDED